jgi:hypothetical protein
VDLVLGLKTRAGRNTIVMMFTRTRLSLLRRRNDLPIRSPFVLFLVGAGPLLRHEGQDFWKFSALERSAGRSVQAGEGLAFVVGARRRIRPYRRSRGGGQLRRLPVPRSRARMIPTARR